MRRINQGGHRPAADGPDDFLVGHVAADDRVEVAAALAGHERCRVHRREKASVLGERVRQRGARLHLLVDGIDHGLECRVGDALPQDVQRLDQRHPGFEERRQFLVEDEEFPAADPAAARGGDAEARQHSAPAQRQDEKAFLLQFPAQPRFAVGDVDAFDHLAARSAEPAPEFHRSSLDRLHFISARHTPGTRGFPAPGHQSSSWPGTVAGTKVLSTAIAISTVSPVPS